MARRLAGRGRRIDVKGVGGWTSCQQLLMESSPIEIAEDVLSVLESRDRQLTAKARKNGHRHVIATVPCRKAPSILKRHGPANKFATGSDGGCAYSSPKRRRICCKTSASDTVYGVQCDVV